MKRAQLLVAGMLLTVCHSARAASSELDARVRKVPSDPQQALSLVVDLRRAGRSADALRIARNAYLKAQRGDAAIALRLEAARSLVADGKPKDALRECAGLKGLSTVRRRVCEGEVYLSQRRATLALPAAHEILAADPKDYDGLLIRGRAQRQRGKLAIAEKVLRRAVADSSRWEAHYWLADVLIAAGRSDEAKQELRLAISAEPAESEPYYLLATLLPAGNEALEALQHATDIRPAFGAALARRAVVELDLGKAKEAEASARAAVITDPRQADWRAVLARALLAQGDAVGALKEARAVLAIVANHGPAKLVEAEALSLQGDIDGAVPAYQAAYAATRSEPTALILGARACVAHGRPTTALAFAERATQEFSESGAAWEVKGDVHAASREVPEARHAYQKALAGQGTFDRDGVKRKLAALK